ncbi:MAG: hypothetical protein WD025_02435 [Bacteriovoracaceae bacterium]
MNENKKSKNEKSSDKEKSSTMRMDTRICNKISSEVEKLNKLKKGKKKITPSDILEVLLPLFNEDHKKQVLAQTITSVDRQDTAFLNYKKKHKETTKTDFLDLIQYGEIQINDYLPEEMKRQKFTNNVNKLGIA